MASHSAGWDPEAPGASARHRMGCQAGQLAPGLQSRCAVPLVLRNEGSNDTFSSLSKLSTVDRDRKEKLDILTLY